MKLLFILTILTNLLIQLSALQRNHHLNSSEKVELRITTKQGQIQVECNDAILHIADSLKVDADSILINCVNKKQKHEKAKREKTNSVPNIKSISRSFGKVATKTRQQIMSFSKNQKNNLRASNPGRKMPEEPKLKLTLSDPVERSKKSHIKTKVLQNSDEKFHGEIIFEEIVHVKSEKGDDSAKLIVYYLKDDKMHIAEIYFKRIVSVEDVKEFFIKPLLEKRPDIKIARKDFLEEFNRRVSLLEEKFLKFHIGETRLNKFILNRYHDKIKMFTNEDLTLLEKKSLHQCYKTLDLNTQDVQNSQAYSGVSEKEFFKLKAGFNIINKYAKILNEKVQSIINENPPIKSLEDETQTDNNKLIQSQNTNTNEPRQGTTTDADSIETQVNIEEDGIMLNPEEEDVSEEFLSLMDTHCNEENDYEDIGGYISYKALRLYILELLQVDDDLSAYFNNLRHFYIDNIGNPYISLGDICYENDCYSDGEFDFSEEGATEIISNFYAYVKKELEPDKPISLDEMKNNLKVKMDKVEKPKKYYNFILYMVRYR
jgi:hypothetical protein